MSTTTSPLFSLDGEVAVVMGAAGLLGQQMASALAEHGAHVALCDLDEAGLGRAAEVLIAEGRPAPFACVVDITNEDSVDAACARVLARFGRCDVLVNAAADKDAVRDEDLVDPAHNPLRFENFPLAAWQRSIDLNLTGTFLTCRAFGAKMAAAGRGSIINIGSTYGVVAPDQRLYLRADGSQTFWKSAAYPASKGGVVMLTRFLAAYWGPAGVRVNVLCPGGVAQGQPAHFVQAYAARTPLGRMAEAHELRGATVFLASRASSYVTGSTLLVDGGVDGMVSPRRGATGARIRGLLQVDEVALQTRTHNVRAVAADCDGTLTDGLVYVSEQGEHLKCFSLRDGLGAERLRAAGLSVVVITRERSPQVERRCEKLGLGLFQGVLDKAAHLPVLCRALGVEPGQVAYIGDDLNDLVIMRQIAAAGGVCAAPADAEPEIRAAAHLVTARPGGRGAFRDFAETLLALRTGVESSNDSPFRSELPTHKRGARP